QPIFPGVMGLEMFIEFNNFMNHNDVKQIKNVEFNKPIKLLSKKPVEIRVSLNSNINQLTIETIRYPKILKGKPKLTQHFSAQLFNEDSLQNEKDIITKSEKRGFKFFQNFNTNQSNFDLLTKEEIYEIFFHGNSFQVLDGLEQFISNGSITRVKFPQETMMLLNKGKPKSKISNKDFHVNVLGIESLFQAAGLYNLLANNNLSLPSTIGELKIGKTDNRDWNEPKHAIVEFLYQKADISYFDAVLLDKNQNLIIKLDKLGLVHTQLPIKTSKEISRKIEILSRSISFQVKSKIDLINILPISIINENFSIAQKKVEKNQKNNIEGNSSQDGVLMINDYLTLNEIKKFDRITNIKRKLHFLTGHLALKELIQQVDPNLKPYNQIEINYTIKGKPYIPPFEVKDPSKEKKFYPSITHSGDYAIAVLDQSQIGIDLEKVEEHLDTFYSEVFTDQEQSKIGKDKVLATKFWTVKEAFLKAIGEGLNLNIKDLSVDFISNNESEHDVNLPSIFSIKTENNNTQIDILAKKSKITSYYIKDYVLSICYINTQEGR
ncbi:MAG: 4'-phosphopantetheinyl transferase superfamily protein, partial [Candidatus Lokiarchaeota archaeon]